MEVEYEYDIDYKYIYCVFENGFRRYYLYEADTRYIHDREGYVVVIRCKKGDLIYAKAKENSFSRFSLVNNNKPFSTVTA
jgi:hypothetical protein